MQHLSAYIRNCSTAKMTLPILQEFCSFEGYDTDLLMKETERLRVLITKRATLEILMPLLYDSSSSLHKVQKIYEGGFSSKALAIRLSANFNYKITGYGWNFCHLCIPSIRHNGSSVM